MRRITHILLALLAIALFYSCSLTRRIPDDEILYTGLKGVKVNDTVPFPPEVLEALKKSVDVRTNKKFLFLFPVGLWTYNAFDVNDSTKGFKKWIYNKFAEEPVLVSEVRPSLRVKMLENILDNNGYFRGTASYQLVQKNDSSKKASIRYEINPGPVYPIDSIQLLPDTSLLCHMIDSLAMRDPYLKCGERFSLDSLSAVRTRIANRLKYRGYYFFRPENIEYLADSLYHRGSICLKMCMASNAVPLSLQRYRTGTITIITNRNKGGGTPDTIPLDGITLIQMKPARLRPQTIAENVTFKTGKYFSIRDYNNTQSYLSRLGIFNAINIEALPDSTAAEPTLDVYINATFDIPLEASFEVNATSKSNSYIGPGLSIGITNHNIFGGGEQFNVKATGAYEWQTGKGARSIFNSYEFGLSASLAFPRLLAPKFVQRRRRQINWTKFTLSGNLLNRPHYFKLAQFNLGISYDWNSTRYVSNSFTPFKLTYNKLITSTAEFDSIMAENPAVAQSFADQFVPQLSYTYTYDRAIDRNNSINCTFTLTEAGNVFWGIYQLCGVKGEKKLFGTPFSQFVKGQAQVVYSRRVTSGNQWIVSRIAIGAAHAYGNSSQVPYSEQFYCGGANSVRAFTVRSIGPGSYHQDNVKNGYFDQTGTFKFEANVEYRFPIFGPIHGALFLDAGNVWLLKNDPARPGGTLNAKTFFKDIALGTGLGLRLDMGMLVVRGDLGIGLHAPYDTGKSGYFNMPSFKKSLAFHLAIGYPF